MTFTWHNNSLNHLMIVYEEEIDKIFNICKVAKGCITRQMTQFITGFVMSRLILFSNALKLQVKLKQGII